MPMQYAPDDDSLLKVREIVRDTNADPPRPGLLPIGRTKFLRLVRAGLLPQPIRLGARGVFWKRSDIERIREHGVAR
jgi:hypothetical protein